MCAREQATCSNMACCAPNDLLCTCTVLLPTAELAQDWGGAHHVIHVLRSHCHAHCALLVSLALLLLHIQLELQQFV